MTSKELREILASPEFKQDLGEISSSLASIAPETPIIHCLGKHLWKRKNQFTFQIEAKRRDLVVNHKRIEFKGTYDFSMTTLKTELTRCGDKSIKEVWDARDKKKSTGWGAMLKFYQDMCDKQPLTDFFVL